MADSDPKYCPSCGDRLTSRRIEGRTRPFCEECGRPVYRNPKPCAGVLVVDDDGRVLLIERTEPPAAGAWSVPAEYLEADEPPEAAAARELREEASLSVSADALTLLDTPFVEHAGGHSVLVVIYVAPRSATTGSPRAGSDAADARFWDLATLREGDERIEPGYEPILRRAVETVSGTDGG